MEMNIYYFVWINVILILIFFVPLPVFLEGLQIWRVEYGQPTRGGPPAWVLGGGANSLP
jgi:hypothetical protein